MSQEHREPDGSDEHREQVREIINEDRELLDQLKKMSLPLLSRCYWTMIGMPADGWPNKY